MIAGRSLRLRTRLAGCPLLSLRTDGTALPSLFAESFWRVIKQSRIRSLSFAG